MNYDCLPTKAYNTFTQVLECKLLKNNGHKITANQLNFRGISPSDIGLTSDIRPISDWHHSIREWFALISGLSQDLPVQDCPVQDCPGTLIPWSMFGSRCCRTPAADSSGAYPDGVRNAYRHAGAKHSNDSHSKLLWKKILKLDAPVNNFSKFHFWGLLIPTHNGILISTDRCYVILFSTSQSRSHIPCDFLMCLKLKCVLFEAHWYPDFFPRVWSSIHHPRTRWTGEVRCDHQSDTHSCGESQTREQVCLNVTCNFFFLSNLSPTFNVSKQIKLF